MQGRATLESDLRGVWGFAGEWCRPVSLFLLLLAGNMRAMGITLLENNSLNSGGAGAGPRLNSLSLIRDVSPKIRPLEFQPVSFLCQPTTNRLREALHLKEGIPFFRAALPANDDRVPAKFSLVEELLHQEFVLHIIVGKLINAEKIESTVILNTSL